ncbi:MAG: hypothetical protein U0232_27930 [Thermomicrobiales bacterium]
MAGPAVIAEDWVEEATAFQVPNGPAANIEQEQGYCYQFWRCRHNAYRGDGAFGQYCVVLPDQDAVLAITSGLRDMQPPLNLVWEHLLPRWATRRSRRSDRAGARGGAQQATTAHAAGRGATRDGGPGIGQAVRYGRECAAHR